MRTLPLVYFSASSLNLSAPLPFGVSFATTWLNLMMIGDWAMPVPGAMKMAAAAAARSHLRIDGLPPFQAGIALFSGFFAGYAATQPVSRQVRLVPASDGCSESLGGN